jgi:hypothetical protein
MTQSLHFFPRCLSWIVFKTEEKHLLMRAAICNYMEAFLEKFQGIYGLPKQATMDDISIQRGDGVWGTDRELFAFASMTETVVYVWCKYGTKWCWQRWRPERATITEGVYIMNFPSNIHYQVVQKP